MHKQESKETFGGLQGTSGLRSKKDENEGWGGASALDWEAPDDRSGRLLSKNTGNFGNAGGGRDSGLGNRDDGRSSVGSNYAGFGLMGKSKSSGKKKEDDDDIDDILGDIEVKKGIETVKQTSDLRNTQNNKKSEAFSQSKQMFKSSNVVDPWGRETFNDLDDIDDNKSNKVSANKDLMDKKRAIFGLGGGGNVTPTAEQRPNRFSVGGGALDQKNNIADLQVREQQTSKSLGRLGLG